MVIEFEFVVPESKELKNMIQESKTRIMEIMGCPDDHEVERVIAQYQQKGYRLLNKSVEPDYQGLYYEGKGRVVLTFRFVE
jgi:hypothetical protein